MIKDWRRVYKHMKETNEMGKSKQEELGEEVAALKAELAQLLDQLASKEYVLTLNETDLANKEKELTV